MRDLTQYSHQEWFKCIPIYDGFKQLRNDLRLNHFIKTGKSKSYLKRLNIDTNTPLIISIAFNKPEVIRLLIKNFQLNVEGATLLVADNSSNPNKRLEIKQSCKDNKIAYIPLPKNKIHHPNRSHGMAMQWCYKRIVEEIAPKIFGFIDHDLLPLTPVNIKEKLGEQSFYGVKWLSQKAPAWQLWAGYCFFHYPTVAGYPLNFLYDFSNGLDTGGRNYQTLYRHFDTTSYVLAADQILEKKTDNGTQKIHRIDQDWLHLGGAGHRASFDNEFNTINEKLAFIKNIGLSKLEQAGYSCTTRHL